jgi:HSP20 family protein
MRSWDLFRELEGARREMDDLFRGLGFSRVLEPSFATTGARHYPRINLREDTDRIEVKAVVPGVDPKALEMTVLKNTLTLAGERKTTSVENVTWHRRERGAGRFLRTIDLPAEIDSDNVKAAYRDGIITITLPKAASARPKQIDIQVA